MKSAQGMQLVFGIVVGLLCRPVLRLLIRSITIRVENETAIMITRFGKLIRVIKEPGLHFFIERSMPWIRLWPVSLQRDFRDYVDIHINDCRGTSVIIDLWIEFKIVDPEKALFSIEGWEQSLKSVLTHSATSILCTKEFNEILCNRNELGHVLQNDIQTDTARWGIEVEMVMIRKVSLLPDVSRQMFTTVAARLERAKANLEEEGRLQVAQLEAETSSKIAALVAEAKGQYPAAVGRAFMQLKKSPKILKAYQELYELALVRPHRLVSFQGFDAKEMKAIDAAMVAPPMTELISSEANSMPQMAGGVMLPPLSSAEDYLKS
jgi:regulator of protease activity HflC (stomatin/prohibitin superfamily)